MNTSTTQPENTNHTTTMLAIALFITMLFTACSPLGGGDTAEGDVYSSDTSIETIANLYTSSTLRAVANVDNLVVFEEPGGASMMTLPGATGYGTTRVMLVEAMAGDWVQVRLPTRPNHRLGWVEAADVKLEQIDPIVHIDLEARTLTVIADEEVLAQTTVAVGSAENPTPLGTFYITDKLETPDPNGAYGPFALGLSGYSETLSEFGGGNGQIGIHGTNDVDSIGQAASHGCVRLPNDMITWLADTLPLGTPVHIV